MKGMIEMSEKKKSDIKRILNLFTDKDTKHLVGGYGTTGHSKYEILLEEVSYKTNNLIVIGIYENRVMAKVDNNSSRRQMIMNATRMEFYFDRPEGEDESPYDGTLTKVKIKTTTGWDEDFRSTVRATPLLHDLFGIVWEAENIKISFKHKPLEKLIGNYYVACNNMAMYGKRIIKDYDTI